ncbi:4-hydroxy-tetrahydrodipicolinate synthase [Ginsengibacter hankyongi]|uniref:4-hydroxy-tetrahydrodipicolinate synthase n=1 Tax=Ginsengibacter hankyongi TaxID=2607284 RepID=A0A5J5ID09_9BACT|nr:4-hydroxy-tetrahydrodipicolinate synthase [Ginsengibacter hankyongi]KAA9036565.1 4-hydroxy-tetrahydrodipicolinate synthase [Ginsengibacter hankyongi]
MSLKNTLQGTGVALVTPFRKNFEVDYDALEKLIDNLIKNGVEYLVSLGTTGETPTLNKTEMVDIINCTVDKVNHRVPVVVGIGGNNTEELLKSIDLFPLDKTVAVLSSSPNYNKPSQEGIFQHYKKFAEACPKPVILYNVPGRTGSNITAETTVRLAHECENIAGIKEASGNMIQCMHILKDRPEEFLVVSGDDHLALPLIACGMDGVISVAANCFPKDFSEMIRSALSLSLHRARKLQYKLLVGMDLLFAENNPAGVKCFLTEMGMIENVLRLPLVPLSPQFHQKVKEFIVKNL